MHIIINVPNAYEPAAPYVHRFHHDGKPSLSFSGWLWVDYWPLVKRVHSPFLCSINNTTNNTCFNVDKQERDCICLVLAIAQFAVRMRFMCCKELPTACRISSIKSASHSTIQSHNSTLTSAQPQANLHTNIKRVYVVCNAAQSVHVIQSARCDIDRLSITASIIIDRDTHPAPRSPPVHMRAVVDACSGYKYNGELSLSLSPCDSSDT